MSDVEARDSFVTSSDGGRFGPSPNFRRRRNTFNLLVPLSRTGSKHRSCRRPPPKSAFFAEHFLITVLDKYCSPSDYSEKIAHSADTYSAEDRHHKHAKPFVFTGRRVDGWVHVWMGKAWGRAGAWARRWGPSEVAKCLSLPPR